MQKLYYCDSIYGVSEIQDLNPLILAAYPKGSILVICAREGQEIRLQKKQFANVTVSSWWHSQAFASHEKLASFDIIVILDKKRIDTRFHPALSWVETTVNENRSASSYQSL